MQRSLSVEEIKSLPLLSPRLLDSHDRTWYLCGLFFASTFLSFFYFHFCLCRDLRAKRRGREYRPKKNESLAKSEISTHLLSRNVFCKCVCVCVYSRKPWKTSGLLFAVCSQLSFIRMWLVPARATEAPAEDVARFQRAHSDRGLLLWAASGRIRCHSLLQCRVFKHWITEVLAPGLEWCLTKRRLEIKENLNLMNMH